MKMSSSLTSRRGMFFLRLQIAHILSERRRVVKIFPRICAVFIPNTLYLIVWWLVLVDDWWESQVLSRIKRECKMKKGKTLGKLKRKMFYINEGNKNNKETKKKEETHKITWLPIVHMKWYRRKMKENSAFSLFYLPYFVGKCPFCKMNWSFLFYLFLFLWQQLY